ncbi:MAG: 16S rRNA (cytidine(1402)-2'-O)-methyltransferase [Actinomycetia bacterium]|nr:16S rRNA (cytidine(1402)-2'-O)-methyltransferase [Actinomycetes bacterium]
MGRPEGGFMTLFVVATPIGNLEDVSARTRRTLADVAVIACEDTRRTGKLLELLGVPRSEFVRVDAHTEATRGARLIERLLAGEDVALVSDAGTPAVSDPGEALVGAAIEAGIEVIAIPGPSASLAALVVSGLPTDRFVFEGFLPRKGRARADRIGGVASSSCTSILFESPKRLRATLVELGNACDAERPIAVCRELTKLHEQVVRGTIAQVIEMFDTDPRGEVVIVVGPAPPEDAKGDSEIVTALEQRRALGLDRRSAVVVVTSDFRIGRRRVYDLALELDWDPTH